MTLSVSASQSIATGFMLIWMIGMLLVDQVSAEKPTASPSLSQPRFLRAWNIARLALPPLLNKIASLHPCFLANASSNARHCSPMLSFFACTIKSASARFVLSSSMNAFLMSRTVILCGTVWLWFGIGVVPCVGFLQAFLKIYGMFPSKRVQFCNVKKLFGCSVRLGRIPDNLSGETRYSFEHFRK